MAKRWMSLVLIASALTIVGNTSLGAELRPYNPPILDGGGGRSQSPQQNSDLDRYYEEFRRDVAGFTVEQRSRLRTELQRLRDSAASSERVVGAAHYSRLINILNEGR